jgi:DNA repair protein RecN (Recombination protein N)
VALAGDDGDVAAAVDGVARAQRLLESLAKLDPALGALAERLVGLDSELRDVAADLERALAGIEGDPARLAIVEDRLGELERLRRKYGGSELELLATRDELASDLASIEGAGLRERELEDERKRQLADLAQRSKRLTAGRKKAARALCKRLEAPLGELAMSDARFEVALSRAPTPTDLPGAACGPGGAEAPEFLFSANPGSAPRPLRKVASGGELSRVYLALKNALRGAPRGMVLVFGEVDAGIGGGVAERVGRVLAELAQDHQVVCITHLPQIAALAQRHFVVSKQRAGRQGHTAVGVREVTGEARVDEVARMAGGENISQATRKHARELLRVKTPERSR